VLFAFWSFISLGQIDAASDDLSNSGLPFRRHSEGRSTGRPNTVAGETMTQYLIAIHHPDDYDPAVACRAPVEVRPFH